MVKAKESGADSTGDEQSGNVEAAQGAATAVNPGTERVSLDDYTSDGRTKVAVPRGYEYLSADTSIPVIDHVGIKVTAEQAAFLVEESGKLVLVVEDDDKEGE